MQEENRKDALGNDIVLGKRYGYTQCSNGLTRMTVGEVFKFNKDTVTLNVVLTNLNGNPYHRASKKVSVRSMMLFPCFNFRTFEEKQRLPMWQENV